MNLKLSTVLALVIVVALPSASLYAWQMGRIQPPEFGRETAITYAIITHEELESLVLPSEWETKDLTPEGLLGASKLQYTTDGWTVIVSYPVVWKPTYTVEIDFEGEGGFHWKGTVDQVGTVIETEFELKG